MDYYDIEYLAQEIGRAIAEALEGVSIKVDMTELGYAAADAINANRARDGKTELDL